MTMNLPPAAARVPDALLAHAKVLSDRRCILPYLGEGGVFVEVGVGLGDFTSVILEICKPSLFIAIDNFRLHELPLLWGRPTASVFGELTHGEFYEDKFSRQIKSGQMRVLTGESADMIDCLEDDSVDVIYLDADHRYEFIIKELVKSVGKVRRHGWILLNDYIMVAELGADGSYGVVQATNEFMISHNWGMRFIALHTRMFCDVALRRQCVLDEEAKSGQFLLSENQRLLREIALIKSSTSWRASKPLRNIVDMLRNMPRRIFDKSSKKTTGSP